MIMASLDASYLSTTCCACWMICSSSVFCVAISSSDLLSAALGPASLLRFAIPTGAELRHGPSWLMFLLCCRRSSWCRECSRS